MILCYSYYDAVHNEASAYVRQWAHLNKLNEIEINESNSND